MMIGIPRAMYYYQLYPQWKKFFSDLGIEVVTSPVSDQRIADEGIKLAIAEACYPVKIMYGHVQYLSKINVDYIFLPRLVSIEAKYYICPKLMGLPDMIKAQIDSVPLIDLCIDMTKGGERNLETDLRRWAKRLGIKEKNMLKAWFDSQQATEEFNEICRQGFMPAEAIKKWEGRKVAKREEDGLKIGFLGHCYVLNDPVITAGIRQAIKDLSAILITAEMLNQDKVEFCAKSLPKRVFWSQGRKLAGAALAMDQDPDIAGIIFLTCFGCGPDSTVAKIIEQRVKNKPYMMLTVDEHSGETGIVTRIEAFCDMLKRRPGYEDHISPDGQQLYCY